ncbi:MAG: fibronectin type III domain-containing protein, partial [Gammaproteobacteria bacterium]
GPAPPDQAGFGSVTLSWTPPTENADGSVLTDLAGYKVYYGNEPGNYTMSLQIDNPGIATYVVENLTPNTYYFVLTAINSRDIESEYSNEAIKQIFE